MTMDLHNREIEMCTVKNEMENSRSIKDEAFEFLWFSYFGIRKEDTDEKAENGKKNELITICAQRAYLDLCRTIKFVKDESKNNISKKEKDERADFQGAICEIIAGNIKYHILKSDEDSYDDIHKKVCTFIIEKVNSYKDDFMADNFTYGQAQKWLNMTIKYMYLMGFWKDEFKNIEKALHIPVDSYIIQAVWGNDDIKLPLIKDKLLKNGTRGAYSDEKIKKWSKWRRYEYRRFQNTLKKYLAENLPDKTPLEWEAEVWMGAANENK